MLTMRIELWILRAELAMIMSALYVVRILNWRYTPWRELQSEVNDD
jgi:hypothetical protein